MKRLLAILLLFSTFSEAQELPIVEFDFFIETVMEDVDSVVIDVIITGPATDTVYAYIINEVSSNALIGTDFYMESPYQMMFLPLDTTSQQLVIHIEDDGDIEGTEAIMLAVESTVGPAITGTEAEHVVFITDNDSCLAQIHMTDTLVCNDASAFALSGSPAGGVFSGSGVIGDMFYPQLCDPGLHNVVYTINEPSCNDSTAFQVEVEVCAGIEEYVRSDLKISPNPATDAITLTTTEALEQGSRIEVLDAQGRMVQSTVIANRTTTIALDIKKLANGAYFISISDLNNVKMQRLIVHR